MDGLCSFFERLREGFGFHNEPHSLTPYGDELVVAYATNTISEGRDDVDRAQLRANIQAELAEELSEVDDT